MKRTANILQKQTFENYHHELLKPSDAVCDAFFMPSFKPAKNPVNLEPLEGLEAGDPESILLERRIAVYFVRGDIGKAAFQRRQ